MFAGAFLNQLHIFTDDRLYLYVDPGKAQSKDLELYCSNLGAGIGRSSFFYFYAGSRLRFGRWIFKVCRKQRILLCTLLWMGEACFERFSGKRVYGYDNWSGSFAAR